MEAVSEMVNVIERLGEMETRLKMAEIDQYNDQQMVFEDIEKKNAYKEAAQNEFLSKLMGGQVA